MIASYCRRLTLRKDFASSVTHPTFGFSQIDRYTSQMNAQPPQTSGEISTTSTWLNRWVPGNSTGRHTAAHPYNQRILHSDKAALARGRVAHAL
jgi:hypothetical protein